MKIVVGVTTGSLGILSEAAHSTLDLVAAVVTLWAVRVSGKPADPVHTYGHAKFENISALFETVPRTKSKVTIPRHWRRVWCPVAQSYSSGL